MQVKEDDGGVNDIRDNLPTEKLPLSDLVIVIERIYSVYHQDEWPLDEGWKPSLSN